MSGDPSDPANPDLDVPAWARLRPEDDPTVKARRRVEAALRDVVAYSEGREAVYVASREDEALALTVLATLREWKNNQSYASRVRFLALIIARARRGK